MWVDFSSVHELNKTELRKKKLKKKETKAIL